ncbi:hypothetical protein B484DRAFT_399489, partial [Ochromonadaceae sp. CCMP2298]
MRSCDGDLRLLLGTPVDGRFGLHQYRGEGLTVEISRCELRALVAKVRVSGQRQQGHSGKGHRDRGHRDRGHRGPAQRLRVLHPHNLHALCLLLLDLLSLDLLRPGSSNISNRPEGGAVGGASGKILLEEGGLEGGLDTQIKSLAQSPGPPLRFELDYSLLLHPDPRNMQQMRVHDSVWAFQDLRKYHGCRETPIRQQAAALMMGGAGGAGATVGELRALRAHSRHSEAFPTYSGAAFASLMGVQVSTDADKSELIVHIAPAQDRHEVRAIAVLQERGQMGLEDQASRRLDWFCKTQAAKCRMAARVQALGGQLRSSIAQRGALEQRAERALSALRSLQMHFSQQVEHALRTYARLVLRLAMVALLGGGSQDQAEARERAEVAREAAQWRLATLASLPLRVPLHQAHNGVVLEAAAWMTGALRELVGQLDVLQNPGQLRIELTQSTQSTQSTQGMQGVGHRFQQQQDPLVRFSARSPTTATNADDDTSSPPVPVPTPAPAPAPAPAPDGFRDPDQWYTARLRGRGARPLQQQRAFQRVAELGGGSVASGALSHDTTLAAGYGRAATATAGTGAGGGTGGGIGATRACGALKGRSFGARGALGGRRIVKAHTLIALTAGGPGVGPGPGVRAGVVGAGGSGAGGAGVLLSGEYVLTGSRAFDHGVAMVSLFDVAQHTSLTAYMYLCPTPPTPLTPLIPLPSVPVLVVGEQWEQGQQQPLPPSPTLAQVIADRAGRQADFRAALKAQRRRVRAHGMQGAVGEEVGEVGGAGEGANCDAVHALTLQTDLLLGQLSVLEREGGWGRGQGQGQGQGGPSAHARLVVSEWADDSEGVKAGSVGDTDFALSPHSPLPLQVHPPTPHPTDTDGSWEIPMRALLVPCDEGESAQHIQHATAAEEEDDPRPRLGPCVLHRALFPFGIVFYRTFLPAAGEEGSTITGGPPTGPTHSTQDKGAVSLDGGVGGKRGRVAGVVGVVGDALLLLRRPADLPVLTSLLLSLEQAYAPTKELRLLKEGRERQWRLLNHSRFRQLVFGLALPCLHALEKQLGVLAHSVPGPNPFPSPVPQLSCLPPLQLRAVLTKFDDLLSSYQAHADIAREMEGLGGRGGRVEEEEEPEDDGGRDEEGLGFSSRKDKHRERWRWLDCAGLLDYDVVCEREKLLLRFDERCPEVDLGTLDRRSPVLRFMTRPVPLALMQPTALPADAAPVHGAGGGGGAEAEAGAGG